MGFILKADDVMPWGKHQGITLRAVYKIDKRYYTYICNNSDSYQISSDTRRIVENDLPASDRSSITCSSGSKGSRKELSPESKLPGGPFAGQTLKDIYRLNKSYFRYLATAGVYYISSATYTHIAKEQQAGGADYEPILIDPRKSPQILSPDPEERKRYNSVIDQNIADCQQYFDPMRDLDPYSGERIPNDFLPRTRNKIEKLIQSGTYHLLDDLREIYGPTAQFRPGQEEAVLSVLNGRRTLVVQRTGWGKSLVYFLAIKKLREKGKGPAIIISPLIALMRDQIKSLNSRKWNLTAREITSDNMSQWDEIYSDIASNNIDMILIAPEKLANSQFLSQIEQIKEQISLFVIDEAHCISDWGHDFRPDFRRIARFVRSLPKTTAVLATTATANDRVVRDIRTQLGKNLEIQRGSMERENFFIDAIYLGTDGAKLDWLQRNLHVLLQYGSGIIYCLRRKDTERLAAQLSQYGYNAQYYHANLHPDKKIEIEKAFQEGKIDILVATIAFGMGIDKDDIGFIIHYQQASSHVAYYQQIGRAGRDIRKVPSAYAITLIGDHDNKTNIWFITHAFPAEDEQNKTIAFIEEHPGCSRQELQHAHGFGQDQTDKILKYLSVDGYIYRRDAKYYRTDRVWTGDMKRARIVSWHRWQEFRKFNEYLDSKDCYMQQLRYQLDDHRDPTPCGRCANCIGHHFFL